MNLHDFASQCDEAIASGNAGIIQPLVDTIIDYMNEEERDIKEQCYSHYIISNLYSGLSTAHNEHSGGWRENNFPENLASSINHLRQARALTLTANESFRYEIETNLANSLATQRRNIEVLEWWQCDFTIEGDSPFVSTLSKSRELGWLSHWLNDPGHAERYKYTAYRLLKQLQANMSDKAPPAVRDHLINDSKLRKFIQYGDEHFHMHKGWDEYECPQAYSADEKQYRQWCLEQRLFANPLNDITQTWIADEDVLQFPNHTVKYDDGPYFSAAFSSLKREYCFARHMAYEGVHHIHPDYEHRSLYLTDTLDYVDYSGPTEKIKTAFRVCFSVLDSIATLMNVYFECNAKHSAFTSKWIKQHFQKHENGFIDALYWLACDITDTSNIKDWKAPNPDAVEIRKIRNAIEHNWLRVAQLDHAIWDKEGDFAYLITPQKLRENTLFVLKLVRAAMLYFCLAVTFHERNKPSTEKGIIRQDITLVKDGHIGQGLQPINRNVLL